MANQNPQIRIPDFYLEFKEFRQEINEKISELRQSLSNYTTFVIGVLALGFIILLFAFGTLLVQVIQFYLTFQEQSNLLKIQDNVIQNDVSIQQSELKTEQNIKSELDQIKSIQATPTP